jgi:glutaconate CoA-transferase subunit A
MTPGEVIAELRSGMTIGIGGWGARRKPMALVRELVRSDLKDLTLVSYGGPEVGLLAATGKIKKLIFGFVTLDVIPLDAHFRAARQAGRLTDVMEVDEGMFQWGLRAAALRLPFLPTRAGLGTDVDRLNPDILPIASPYEDGETLLAMPALNLDAALCHVDHCDEYGNGQILGDDPYFDDLYCAAAEKSYVSCEKIIPTEDFLEHGCIHSLALNRTLVSGVIETPLGAHPTACVPKYGIDTEHLKEYSAAAKDSDAWTLYRARFVDVDDATYVENAGGSDNITKIPAPVF